MAGRHLPKEPSYVQLLPLDDPKCQESIKLLHKVCASCVGPCGRTKMIRNHLGGHVTVTSASSRLLKTTAISKPVLKLVVASVQNHLERFQDQGLFVLTLCLNLLESYLKTDIHRNLLHQTLHVLLNASLGYLTSEQCLCKFRISLATVQDYMKLTQSILTSKPLCQLSEENVIRISRKIVELFLSTVQLNGENSLLANHGVMYITLEGYPVEDMCVLEGLLYEMPSIPVYRKEPIKLLTVQSGLQKGQLKVMLVDLSMAGDSEVLGDVKLKVTGGGSLYDGVLKQLQRLAQYILSNGVGVVACQKVINPQVRHMLESHGVFVMQRLGSMYTDYLSVLSGVRKWSSLEVPLDESHVGYLRSARHTVYGGRSFVHLQGNQNGQVSTVVMCNRTEEAAEETKTVFQSALHSLHMSTSEPYCLFGAGCWQTHLAQYISDKVEQDHIEWEEELCTNTSTLRDITDIFIQCLRKTALQLDDEVEHMTDRVYAHHWTFPSKTFPGSVGNKSELHGVTSCACGLVAYKDDLEFTYLHKQGGDTSHSLNGELVGKDAIQSSRAEVIDSYSSALNAFQIAVSTAAAVLSIRNIIQQK